MTLSELKDEIALVKESKDDAALDIIEIQAVIDYLEQSCWDYIGQDDVKESAQIVQETVIHWLKEIADDENALWRYQLELEELQRELARQQLKHFEDYKRDLIINLMMTGDDAEKVKLLNFINEHIVILKKKVGD